MYRLIVLALLAIAGDEPIKSPAGPDLSERLGSGAVRAGKVVHSSALFGGSSAEGQVGDYKIYNDRVRFIIQSARSGGYYVEYGGGILDADIVRGWSQPGMDMLDEHAIMAGFGRLMKAESVVVLNDGSNGKAAVIEIKGGVADMQLLTGAVESFAIVPDRQAQITTTYTLQPDSWLLGLSTTIDWQDQTTSVSGVDMGFMGYEVSHSYYPGSGLGEGPGTFGWAAGVGSHNEVAIAMMSEKDSFEANAMLQTISNMSPVIMASQAPVTLSDGDSYTWDRTIGVAPDIATLTDAWYDRRGDAVQTIGGSVTASGELVAGARVHILDASGAPVSMALSGVDGTWTADIPAGMDAQVQAVGRGNGIHYDLAPGAGWYGPYVPDHIRAASLERMASGVCEIPEAQGFGTSTREPASANTPLTLTPPGMLEVNIEDGGPAVVRVDFLDGDSQVVDGHIVPERPSGSAAWLYIKDGFGSIPVEPGEYTVTVHRGGQHSYHSEEVSVGSGELATIEAVLSNVSGRPGIYTADPHAHAGPSGDGGLPMEARLVTHAAHGIDIHFGTDHDHIADYRPLLEPLGLDGVLASVVATEVSPVLRGHFNAYPLEEARGELNHGALPWYQTWPIWETTQGLFDTIRDLPSDGDVIVQSNHPLGNGGLLGNAKYDLATGTVGLPDSWSEDFDAMEVLNNWPSADYVLHYMDLVSRGLSITPVGVSDSHSHRGGVGQALTYVPLPIQSVSELQPDHIRDAWATGGTVPSTGPIIEARVDGSWAPGQTFENTADLSIQVWAPDWMQIDGINIYQNTELIQTIQAEGDAPLHLSVIVALEPEEDAVYFVEVTSSEDMSPVYPGAYAWALTSGIKVNTGGRKWQPPLPAIVAQ